MHRCGSGFLLTLAISFVAAFTGCLGNSSSNPGNGGVSSVTLSPGGIFSMDVGGTQVFSAAGKNAAGKRVTVPFHASRTLHPKLLKKYPAGRSPHR